MHINPLLIKDLETNPYSILEKLSIKEIEQIIKQANHAYHEEGVPLFSDDIYEIIQEYLRKLLPNHPLLQTNIIGYLPKKSKVLLPLWMGSLNKIKDNPEQINKWKAKYKNEYVISDKLDGISCLYLLKDNQVTLFTRGDGKYGQNISNLLKYVRGIPKDINKTKQNSEVMIRGELILTKKDWETIKTIRHNPRNTVAGLANSKKPDENIAKLVWFIAYECIEPANKIPSKSLEWLKKNKFNVVDHILLNSDELTADILSKHLLKRRKESDFEIDGIVINHNKIHNNANNENPPYAFAFKSILTSEQAEVIVKDVKWNISKHGLLKPVVLFDTVYLGGVHIQKAFGHNAQYINTNKIGPGSRIIVIRSNDVIPYIVEILSPSASGEPSLPDNIEPWKWNENKVELVLINPSAAQDYHLKQLENYITVLGIKGLGPKIIKKIFNTGIDSVKKLTNITKIDLYKATYSSALTMKIYNQLQDVYRKGTCVEFMAASNIFGVGFGIRKFKLITENFPDILINVPPTLNEFLSMKGIGERNARNFLQHLNKFHEFMKEVGLPCRSSIPVIEETPEGLMVLNSKRIVFTGFRSKELEEFIIKRGGNVSNTVNNSTHILVAKSLDDSSMKFETAKELDVAIMTLKQFSEEVGYQHAVAKVNEEEDNEFEELKKQLEGNEIEEEEEEDDDKELSSIAECVRHTMNWANMKRSHIFGKSGFDSDSFIEDMPKSSPKLESLLHNIKKLDNKDFEKYGKKFKHMIFSDVTKRGFGAKILAAGLKSDGYNHAYNKEFEINKSKLEKTKGNNFAILAGTQIFTKPINAEFKRKLLKTFNDRPRNINGNDIRFIILDQAYKEGIDLFDVKYVHLYEPLLNYADEVQAIGRATRFCGQKGLHFDDKIGWRLHVYKYDHVLNESLSKEYGGKNSLELILNQMNINKNLLNLSIEFENVCQNGAVDKSLTKSIHNYYHQKGGNDKQLSYEKLKTFINDKYSDLKWPPVYIENQCKDEKKENNNMLKLSPTQKFVKKYFQPSNPYKGLFLWHSIGSGKTCTAVATASSSWEIEGYTILWVTRGTLKSDVYKNMFEMSCLKRIKNYIKAGHVLPKNMADKRKLLSKSWVPAISYKQFNNTLLRQNRLYDYLIKKNGYSDPFRNTLIIIDEAHLMLSPTIKEKDKLDIKLLKSWLRNSYKISEDNSARVLLMSATPITDNPFNFVKLMNLTSEKDIEEEPDKFIKTYLDNETSLKFTDNGKKKFIEDVSGRISYLNRTKDIRQFAQPVIHNINVPISEPTDLNSYIREIDEYNDKITSLKEMKLGNTKQLLNQEIDEKYKNLLLICNEMDKLVDRKTCISNLKIKMKEEKSKVDIIARNKVTKAKNEIEDIKETLKETKIKMKETKKNDVSISSLLNKKCYKKSKEDQV
jgi:DNA ligase (NAD+)